MSHYKPYPVYRDSGVEWIGEVPGHWEVKRLRHIAHFINSNVDKKSYDGQQAVKLCNYTDVYYNEFITASQPFMEATASDAEVKAFALKMGDVLITKDSEDPSDIGIPALVSEDMLGVICGYHLTVIRTHDADAAAFAHRSIQSLPTKAHFFVESLGITRFGLDQDAIGDIRLCLPPAAERKRIASWIQRETVRMDALIAQKTRFIELLKEKRQALITHAVTKGLDPNAKMKDSGVEWIGEVPVHWDVAHVKRFFKQIDYGLSETANASEGIEFLTMGNIQDGGITRTKERFLSAAPLELLLEKGDILFNRTNSLDLVGKVGIYLESTADPVTFASYLVRFRCHARADSEYLTHFLGCEPFLAVARTMALPSVSQANLNPNRYGYLSAPMPPRTEQKKIVEYINTQSARLRLLGQQTERSITLLKERRSALITAAVTGQIDLREKAA
jgi:type I restriction enzyme S subunit